MRSLLDAVVAESVDPSYAKAARSAGSTAAGRGAQARAGAVTVVAAALLSVVIVVTFVQAKVAQQPLEQTRAALEQEIERRQHTSQQLNAQVQQLQAQVAVLSGESPGEGGFSRQDRAAAWVGLSSLTCAGIQLRIVDNLASGADAGGPRAGQGYAAQRLSDRDLQAVVNGLWAAGAQAISINNHRLLATTAIRKAGQAILVDYQPLISPYIVNVCGEGQGLTQALRAGVAGAQLRGLAQQGSVNVSITQQPTVQISGARPRLRYAAATSDKTGPP